MKQIDKNAEKTKRKLKVIGFPTLIIGILCAVIAFVNFFVSIGSISKPSLFFLFFIGFPFIFVGSNCLRMAYMDKVARYTAGQAAPVAKDSVNYMIDGTKDSITSVIKDIRDDKKEKECFKCGTLNDYDAKFCKKCGNSFVKECKYCGEENEADAVYCDNCGKEL